MAEDTKELSVQVTEKDKKPVSSNTGGGRRTFLKNAGRAGIALLVAGRAKPQQVLAESVKEEGPNEGANNKKFGVEWANLYKVCDEIQAWEKDPFQKEIVLDLRRNLELLEKNFNSRMERLEAIKEVMQSDKELDGTPRLIKLYRQMLGNFVEVKPEDVIPFLVEEKMLKSRMEALEFLLTTTRDHQAGRLSREELREYIGSLDWTTAHNFREKELKDKYGFTRDFIAYSNVLTERESYIDRKVNYSQKLSVEIHPSLKPTPEGIKTFGEDKNKIERFLDNFPYFRKVYAQIKLYSLRYLGKEPLRLRVGGWFLTNKEYGERHYKNEIAVVMDSYMISEHLPEVIFAHEAFGHALDAEINETLQDRLSPQQYIERLTFQHQILENPDWGDSDHDIPQLFKRDPVHRSDADFVTKKDIISTTEFRGIITEYPRNLLLTNRFLEHPRFLDSGLPGYLENDPVYKDVPRFSDFLHEERGVYKSFEDFLAMYLPKLKFSAGQGNIRSKFLLWGIENFRKEFSNLKFQWLNPGRLGGEAWAWSEYCRIVLLNAVVYHVFLNGVDHLRNLVPRSGWRDIEKDIYEARRYYRAELFAEGVAFSYYFANRLEEKPPYRVALEHIASLIEAT